MLKEFLAYRKNRKIVRRELAKLEATTLPLINKVIGEKTDLINTVVELVDSTKGITGEELRKEFIEGLAKIIHDENK